ncbi:MAG TPA: glycoside hydrolase family 38 C-terminal domain-containing protein [Anaerolineae bacterium]|nr:glycoside hydrolase family 38 C-terminal domain-containing protein [Anaerolineae bacterium]
MATRTLTFVSHTHWDREWYRPFEEFRIRLVRLMDKLLDILDRDPDFRYFMLDGQTIVLEDYLAIRPEREPDVVAHVRSGRLLIGPWYILPDEFLVSPESTIRNLLTGVRVASRFGRRMDVGNIPDPFGHISQLPQILRGFGMDCAVLWRGVGDAPNEFLWAAPDGSDVLVIHQHDGYGNAARMPAEPEAFVARTKQIIASLSPSATTPHLLAMDGSDHAEPQSELPRLIALADQALPDIVIRHGTLPQFIADVRAAHPALETRVGELRSCSRMPLLPGVLSARMWIKQRNDACETLLTRWAEPFSALAQYVGAEQVLEGQAAFVRQAWHYLLQNHPHDSICGCSIDQVHREMDVRFDWVAQIGEQVAQSCLQAVADAVDTASGDASAVVVFNPTTRDRADVVRVQIPVPDGRAQVALVSGSHTARAQLRNRRLDVFAEVSLLAQELKALIQHAIPMQIEGLDLREVTYELDGHKMRLELVLGQGATLDRARLERRSAELLEVLENEEVQEVDVLVHRGTVAECTFVARDVPGMGYRTYRVQPVEEAFPVPGPEEEGPVIENAFLRVQVAADGTFTLHDKRTGATYEGLNCFVDVGDRGDEYNFCPVEEDVVVAASAIPPLVCLVASGAARQTLEASLIYRVPAGLGETRGERSDEYVDLPVTTRLSLSEGVPRVEIETTVDNRAADHRLRAHFPVPFRVDAFQTEGHFDVITRSTELPRDTEGWAEQPAPTHPQRTWTGVSDGQVGLMLANRGLPEIEVLQTAEGAEVALTLLRCVGWLSRGDLSVRRGPAGPQRATPEAQCTHEYTFHYAVIPHAGSWETAFHEAEAFHTPMRAVSTGLHEGTLEESSAFVRVEPDTLVITALKEAEDGRGLIIRLWNSSPARCEGEVSLWRSAAQVARCNLDESEIEPLELFGSQVVRLAARGNEVVTLRVAFQ